MSDLDTRPVVHTTDATPPARPRADRAPGVLNPRMVLATARRVLTQLLHDRRTIGMLVVVPSVLLTLVRQMLNSQTTFNGTALTLIGIFPFTLMFLITSIAMLRERTGGTLERLMTTPLSKLDLLLGYGIAFAVAGVVQAGVTCLTAYLLLDLYTPGSPLLVLALAVAGALLGMGLGLLVSAFATSEFQAVQFMPIIVMPQVFLGGLFVPREQMSDWLQAVSDFLPLTYSIEGLDEVGSTSLVTGELLRDAAVVTGLACVAVALAATTLKRRTGSPTRAERRRRTAIPLVVLALVAGVAVNVAVDTSRYITTDNAIVDGEQVPIVAPQSGTLLAWAPAIGSVLGADQVIGRLEIEGGTFKPQMVLRSPGEGTVVQNTATQGAYVVTGTELAVLYDLAEVYVTARVDETDLRDVRIGAQVEVVVEGGEDRPLAGVVHEIESGTVASLSDYPPDNAAAVFDRTTQVVPVRIGVSNPEGVTLLPGMNVTVKISRA
jgi:ABC-2 type transport system permease protein